MAASLDLHVENMGNFNSTSGYAVQSLLPQLPTSSLGVLSNLLSSLTAGGHDVEEVAEHRSLAGGIPVVGSLIGGLDVQQLPLVGQEVSAEVADFYAHLCPAGVYERVGDELRVNPPNCVDCKATDVLGPRWTPREGGSGPRYRVM